MTEDSEIKEVFERIEYAVGVVLQQYLQIGELLDAVSPIQRRVVAPGRRSKSLITSLMDALKLAQKTLSPWANTTAVTGSGTKMVASDVERRQWSSRQNRLGCCWRCGGFGHRQRWCPTPGSRFSRVGGEGDPRKRWRRSNAGSPCSPSFFCNKTADLAFARDGINDERCRRKFSNQHVQVDVQEMRTPLILRHSLNSNSLSNGSLVEQSMVYGAKDESPAPVLVDDGGDEVALKSGKSQQGSLKKEMNRKMLKKIDKEQDQVEHDQKPQESLEPSGPCEPPCYSKAKACPNEEDQEIASLKKKRSKKKEKIDQTVEADIALNEKQMTQVSTASNSGKRDEVVISLDQDQNPEECLSPVRPSETNCCSQAQTCQELGKTAVFMVGKLELEVATLECRYYQLETRYTELEKLVQTLQGRGAEFTTPGAPMASEDALHSRNSKQRKKEENRRR